MIKQVDQTSSSLRFSLLYYASVIINLMILHNDAHSHRRTNEIFLVMNKAAVD